MEKFLIPEPLYKKFVKSMPLFCLEGIVKNRSRFILVKRKKSPAKDEWWFPGGRLFFNEDLISAVKRILKGELGIKKIKSIKFLGIGECKFKIGYFGAPSHTVNAIFLAEIDSFQAENIKLDLVDHFGYKWFERIPKNISSYLKKFLKINNFN